MHQAAIAERYCIDDPSASLTKLRLFGELLAKNIAARLGVYTDSQTQQEEIVRRVEILFAIASQLEEKLDTAKSRVERLTNSTLSKAFRGELVPQDPNDEPADQLLARMRAEREALAGNKAGRSRKKFAGRGRETKASKVGSADEPETESSTEAGPVKGSNTEPKIIEQPDIGFEKRFDKSDVLKAFRKAIFRQNDIEEYPLLRLVGWRLGIQRLSQPIREELESHINTAIRRKIIARNGDGLIHATPTIHQYDEEYLIKVLRSVIRKGYEYQREHVVEQAAVYLGYDKVSDAFAERMKAIFRIAIRRGLLYRNGVYVGKA